VAGDRFEDIVVEAGDKRLRALIRGDRGWLRYSSGAGEADVSSRNPDYEGPSDATIEYCRSDGQRDARPASWAYPVDVVRQALDFFEREEKRPPFITWHAD